MIKYRIEEKILNNGESRFIPQKRVLGIWFNIMRSKWEPNYCDTMLGARNVIKTDQELKLKRIGKKIKEVKYYYE